MEKIKQFNIRVYGILIQNNAILLLKEGYCGEKLLKFPGGGLEFGEGIHDCLKREFLEELNQEIEVKEHFYTQDFFLKSKFNVNEQIITHYYFVDFKENTIEILDSGIDELVWLPLNDFNLDLITLPVDKLVIERLIS